MTVPEGDEEIGLATLQHLSIKDGALKWKGEKLKTEIRLSLPQKIAASLLSLIVGAASVVSPIISYYANLAAICTNTANRAPRCPPAVAVDTTGNLSSNPVTVHANSNTDPEAALAQGTKR